MTQYDRLKNYLSTCEGTDILLTFKKINEIISPAHLPASAYEYRNWWANSASNPQASAWMDTGWRVATVNLLHHEVSFTKRH